MDLLKSFGLESYFSQSLVPVVSVSLLLILVTSYLFPMFSRKSTFETHGMHALITGGSQGLGKCVAIELAKLGSHITILARNPTKLRLAVDEIKQFIVSPSQVISGISADVSDALAMVKAFETAKDMAGRTPDLVFCCAGQSIPGWFVDQDPVLFENGMKVNYLGSVITAQAAAKSMIKHQVQGKIVFVGSTLSLMGLVGYSQYAPSKAALKNLADCLRQELQLYDISVHIYLPGTILTPGYDEENKTKPQLTKDIEGVAASLTTEACSKGLLKGLRKNTYCITTDFDTELLRAITSGLAPKTNFFWDAIVCFIGFIASGFVTFDHDRKIKQEKKRRQKMAA